MKSVFVLCQFVFLQIISPVLHPQPPFSLCSYSIQLIFPYSIVFSFIYNIISVLNYSTSGISRQHLKHIFCLYVFYKLHTLFLCTFYLFRHILYFSIHLVYKLRCILFLSCLYLYSLLTVHFLVIFSLRNRNQQ